MGRDYEKEKRYNQQNREIWDRYGKRLSDAKTEPERKKIRAQMENEMRLLYDRTYRTEIRTPEGGKKDRIRRQLGA